MVSFSAQSIKAAASSAASTVYNTGATIITKASTHGARVWTSYAAPAGKSVFNFLTNTPAGIATCFAIAGLVSLASANKLVPYKETKPMYDANGNLAFFPNGTPKKYIDKVDPSYRRFAAYMMTFALFATAIAIVVEGPQATTAYATAKFAAASSFFKAAPVIGRFL